MVRGSSPERGKQYLVGRPHRAIQFSVNFGGHLSDAGVDSLSRTGEVLRHVMVGDPQRRYRQVSARYIKSLV